MKNTLVSLVAGLLVWGSFATAQSNFTLTNGAVANIPFNFTVGNQSFESGTYIVQLDYERQIMVIRNNDRQVRIWDVHTGQEVLALDGHTDAVMSLAFSPDGRRLASGGLDGTIRVLAGPGGRR